MNESTIWTFYLPPFKCLNSMIMFFRCNFLFSTLALWSTKLKEIAEKYMQKFCAIFSFFWLLSILKTLSLLCVHKLRTNCKSTKQKIRNSYKHLWLQFFETTLFIIHHHDHHRFKIEEFRKFRWTFSYSTINNCCSFLMWSWIIESSGAYSQKRISLEEFEVSFISYLYIFWFHL